MSGLLTIAVETARKAGELLRRRFYSPHPLSVEKKAGGELVTACDREAEDLIYESLNRAFPEHGFFGEESGLAGPESCWVIDPLDGTTNFIHGYPQCSVSIAFYENGRIKVGVVHDIVANETFFAEDGGGAFVDSRRLRVSKAASMGDSLIIASGQLAKMWTFLGTMANHSRGVRRGGSTALDLAWLAAGRADAVIGGPARFWDVAAGYILVREAGGLIADIEGQNQFRLGENTTPYVAATPKILVQTLEGLKRYYADDNGVYQHK